MRVKMFCGCVRSYFWPEFAFVLWGSVVLMAIDTIVWNSLFVIINAYRALEEVWRRRPIQFERDEYEDIYAEFFGPVGISRLDVKMLMEHSLLRKHRMGTIFLEAGNEASNLSLIYSGTLEIYSEPKDGPPEKVGTVEKWQFVESPQWANMQIQINRAKANESAAARKALAHSKSTEQQNVEDSSSTFGDEEMGSYLEPLGAAEEVREAATVEVTFKAKTNVIYFSWPMERLQDLLQKNPSIKAPINALIGNDVATKLFQQAKGRKTEISTIQKRIYFPMDLSTNKSASPPLETNDSEKDIFETDSDGILADQSLREAPDLPNNPILAEKLWLKYRSERDTECDQKLAVELMHRTSLNVYELSALLSVGRWRTILRNGTILIREGEPIHYLCMILSGTLSVYKGEGEQARELHIIKSGDLVGSVEFMDSEREHIAGETVVAREPCTYMEWECDELRHFLAFRTHLRAQLMTLLARDLSAKFRQVEQSLSVS